MNIKVPFRPSERQWEGFLKNMPARSKFVRAAWADFLQAHQDEREMVLLLATLPLEPTVRVQTTPMPEDLYEALQRIPLRLRSAAIRYAIDLFHEKQGEHAPKQLSLDDLTEEVG